MTASKQRILSLIRKYKENRKGKLVICFEGQPIPPHNPEDTLVIFEEGDEGIF